MNEPDSSRPRAHDTRWKPGQSGNPKGRPRGIECPSIKLRKLIDVEAVIADLQRSAALGDTQAASVLLSRALPALRPVHTPAAVTGLAEAGTALERAQAVLGAVARGEIAPDVGLTMMQSITAEARIAEITELEQRIRKLEERNDDEQP